MTPEFHLKKGDRLPQLLHTLSDDAGPLNLTGVTAVSIRLRRRETGQSITPGGAGSVVDASTGQVAYAWGAPDAALAPGVYDLEWVLSYGGLPRTVPQSGYVTLVVEPSL